MFERLQVAFLGAAVLASAFSCSRETEQKQLQTVHDTSEHDLITGSATGAGEIGHRLRAAIRLSNDVITLSVDQHTVFISSARPWAVLCGPEGVRVSFGTDDAEITVSATSYTIAECDKLGPVVIGQLRTIMGSRWIVGPAPLKRE